MGQLCEIAETFYNIDNMTVHILESKNDNPDCAVDEQTDAMNDAKAVVVKYRLDFDNRDYVSQTFLQQGVLNRNKRFCALF